MVKLGLGRGENVFQLRVASRLTPNLQTKINSTMCTKTPHGYHRIFRYKPSNSNEVIKTKTHWSLEGGHNEIAVKGKDHYSIEYGPGYQEIRGIKCLVELSNDETTELLYVVMEDHICSESKVKTENKKESDLEDWT